MKGSTLYNKQAMSHTESRSRPSLPTTGLASQSYTRLRTPQHVFPITVKARADSFTDLRARDMISCTVREVDETLVLSTYQHIASSLQSLMMQDAVPVAALLARRRSQQSATRMRWLQMPRHVQPTASTAPLFASSRHRPLHSVLSHPR